jgi:hypothetical protein
MHKRCTSAELWHTRYQQLHYSCLSSQHLCKLLDALPVGRYDSYPFIPRIDVKDDHVKLFRMSVRLQYLNADCSHCKCPLKNCWRWIKMIINILSSNSPCSDQQREKIFRQLQTNSGPILSAPVHLYELDIDAHSETTFTSFA